ncbi:hypothetical protein, partial [Marichromatium gracile]|uniref:hypothetical protein n=2 Tax=Pseudomonadota TaxID=1224 RepID=UPI001906C16D
FVTVACRAFGNRCAEVEVAYALTALSPQGEAVLAEMTEAAYEGMLADWQARITRLLSAGCETPARGAA